MRLIIRQTQSHMSLSWGEVCDPAIIVLSWFNGTLIKQFLFLFYIL